MAKYTNAKLANLVAESTEIDNDAKAQIIKMLRESKTYGLVWERNPEDAYEDLRKNIAVFKEDKSKLVQPSSSIVPNHIIIESDNLYALTTLCYTHEEAFDLIYIDPPYNTGATDWKYNNDYVDSEDAYRHSKWLSLMENRLKIARRLLNKEHGVMIVAIDDYEVSRLTILLEELFPSYDVCPVIVNHHPQGGAADNISRTHEYALYVIPKGKRLIKGAKSEDVIDEWSLMRSGTDVRNLRVGRPKSFYAIHVDSKTLEVKGVGKELSATEEYSLTDAPAGCFAVYPVSGCVERVWRYTRESMMSHIESGHIKCTHNHSLKVIKARDAKYAPIFSVWTDSKYNAGTNGTNLLKSIFGDNRFSYPKSLYTVLDNIKSVVQERKDALILDFFAGSGTTLHATMLLNEEDSGRRRCFLVTNNENNICETVTYERNKRVILGYDQPSGEHIEGLKNNSLRYYKVELKDRELTHQNKKVIFQALTDAICIKENCFSECLMFGRLNLAGKERILKYFEEGDRKVLLIYDTRSIPFIVSEIKAFNKLSEAIRVYVFADGIYPYTEDFKDVITKVDLIPMPGAMFQALKYVLPQQGETMLADLDLTEEEIKKELEEAERLENNKQL